MKYIIEYMALKRYLKYYKYYTYEKKKQQKTKRALIKMYL